MNHLHKYFGCSLLAEHANFGYFVKQLATVAEIDDNVKVLRIVEIFVQPNYVWVILQFSQRH